MHLFQLVFSLLTSVSHVIVWVGFGVKGEIWSVKKKAKTPWKLTSLLLNLEEMLLELILNCPYFTKP